jgi:hypothetical protein
VDDLAVIVVSHDQQRWLPRSLSTLLEHAQGLSLDLVVVDNGASGSARERNADQDKREILARSETTWALLDLASQRPRRVPQAMLVAYGFVDGPP